MEKENINALDEIHKGACMGIDAVHFTLDKVEDCELKKVLENMYDDYDQLAKSIEEIYPDYNEGKPHETGMMTKAMTWYGIEMKTLTDTSNSKIAELLLQGVNMGIIEGRKILNQKKIDDNIRKVVSKYITMQETSVEVLKKYL